MIVLDMLAVWWIICIFGWFLGCGVILLSALDGKENNLTREGIRSGFVRFLFLATFTAYRGRDPLAPKWYPYGMHRLYQKKA